MKHRFQLGALLGRRLYLSALALSAIATGYSDESSRWNKNEEGSFLLYRRQSLIGEETYSAVSENNAIVIKSSQSENERGKKTGFEATLRLTADLTPVFYENTFVTDESVTNVLKITVEKAGVQVTEATMDMQVKPLGGFFPLHSDIPAAMEMMLYHYYFSRGLKTPVVTYPRGQVSIEFRKRDVIEVNGGKIALSRYRVKGINWGPRTVWLDEANNLIATVKANTQFREVIRKGYEAGMPVFINGHVEEEMASLGEYTRRAGGLTGRIIALVGGDVVDGVSPVTRKDMTLVVEDGRITQIGSRVGVAVPKGANVIDVTGKVLIPGLWDMHAHANQVQWAPAYLAGGVTTIRDNGNEVEFATAFRDAIASKHAMGPDILLAGMTDGEGIQGNGIIRARTPEEARAVVAMYVGKGYKQIKIYNSLKPEILKVVAEEAHKRGVTVTGHVPKAVGDARTAVELGMDMLSHDTMILSLLSTGKGPLDLSAVTPQQIEAATNFFLAHKTVLDPTISLRLKSALPVGTSVESIIPKVGNMAYELWEGKRFQKGVSPEKSKKAGADIQKTMEIIGHFARSGVPVVAGTDNAVPVFSLYLEIESYSKLGKLTPLQALQSATIVPARAMGLGSSTGTLEVGKEADIAILEQNPLEDIGNIKSVSAVMTNGSYFSSQALWPLADFSGSN